MGAAAVHPSQRRFSCESCRRIKARCQRLYPNDAKCARCRLLGLDCTTGQQKRVGRPRRNAHTDDGALKHTGKLAVVHQPTPRIRTHDHVENSSAFHESVSNRERNHRQDQSMNFPIDPSIASLGTGGDGTYFESPASPAVNMSFLDPNPLTWDASNDLDDTFFSSNNDSAFRSTSSSSTPSLNAPSTASPPTKNSHHAEQNILETPAVDRTDFITTSNAMAQLSKTNLDLHIRMAAVEANRATLNFNGIIYEIGPLFIENLTLAHFLLKASQEFIHLLTRILRSRATWGMWNATQTAVSESLMLSSQSHANKPRHPPSISSSTPSPASEILFAPIALSITSIFTQIVTLCELHLELLSIRIERMATDPILSLPGLTFGGLPLSEPCLQGVVFCELVIHLLESIEHALGLNPVAGVSATGLLSARQKDVLWSELDCRPGNVLGYGTMRPYDVRVAFGRLRMVLKQIYLDQLTARH